MRFFTPITESQLQSSIQADKDNEYKASVSSAIHDESLERIACDTAIVNSLAAESSNRIDADAALQSSIAAEKSARLTADDSLKSYVDGEILNESESRAAQFKTVGDSLNDEVNARQNADATLSSAINQIQTQINNDATVKSALENEISARTGETASINSAIDGLKALHNLDKAELQSSISAEKSARQSDVSILQSSISAVDSNYKAAVVTLKSYVDGEFSILKSSDTAIIALLNSEVTLRANQTSSLSSALQNEIIDRAGNFNSASNSIGAINNALNAEIANRQNKDSQLQSSLETAVTNFNAAYKVFGGSTTEHAGTAGIVPPPPILEDSDTVYYLTNRGWGEPIELDIKIGKIPSQAGSLTFNGKTQTPDWNDYDPLALEISGETSASDAGIHTVYFQPRDGYKWTNGTRDKMSATYTINAYVVSIPSAATTSFEFTGDSITLNVVNFDSNGSSQTGVTSAVAKGDYTAKYELKNTKNYIFSDNTTAAKTISWHITVKSIAKPTISNTSFTYDGNSHAPTVTGFNAAWLNKTGSESSINVGNFTITVSLKDKTNTQWVGGGTADVSLNWVVNRKKLTAAQSSGFEQNGTITYGTSSDSLTVSIKNFDSSIHKLSGDVTKTYAGTYTAYVSPADNLCWNDGTFAAKPVSWEIKKRVVTKPTSKGTLTYNGATQTGVNVPDSYADSYCIVTGKTGINVGNYTCTYSISNLNKSSVTWDDGSTDDVTLNWSIVKGNGFSKPSLNATSFEWTGSNISPTINNFNSNTMSKSGSDTAVALGAYSITIALKDKTNTSWADGSTADVTLTWSITKRTLTKPALATSSFDYNGSSKTPTVNNFNSSYMQKSASSVNSAINAGNYSIVISLKDKNNCQWVGGGTADVTLNWVINRQLLSAVSFSQSGSLLYNGNSQNVSISGYNSSTMDLGSTTSAVNAGTYTATVTPKPNYAWSDGSYAAKNVSWSINKVKFNKPTLTNTTFTYDGNNHSPTINNYYSDYMNMTGTSNTATAGTYTLTFSLKDTVNRAWADDTTANVTGTWTINKLSLTQPTLTNTSYTYDGNNKSPTINNYDSTRENMTGTTDTATAGTYTVTFSLKDTTNTAFKNSTATSIDRTWTINKAYPTLTVSESSVTFDNDSSTTTVTVTYNGDGYVSVSTANGYVNASLSQGIITLSSTHYATDTVSVTAGEGINYKAFAGGSRKISVNSQYVSPFSACKDWAEIKRIIIAGKAVTYWNVGDYRSISGSSYYSNGTWRATIAHFDYHKNENNGVDVSNSVSVSNSVDFILTASDGTPLVHRNFTLGSVVTSDTTNCAPVHHVGEGETNATSFYYQSYIATKTVPTCINSLPTDLKNILMTRILMTTSKEQRSAGTYQNDGYGGTTYPKLWLLDTKDPTGNGYSSIVRYSFFANGNKITGCNWWTRSPSLTTIHNDSENVPGRYRFANGSTGGDSKGNIAMGLVFGFRIGA